MKYNAMVFPRAFSVTVDAEDEDDAMKKIEEYVLTRCTVTLIRDDEDYDPENLLDDGVDICDLVCKEE